MNNSELQLADQVARHNDFGIATVKQITDSTVTFFRPYTVTADFSYTGGVICYVGIQTWNEERNDTRGDWTLIDRKPLK